MNKVMSGDPLAVDARAYNHLVDLTRQREALAGSLDELSSVGPLARNVTGQVVPDDDIPAFGVVAITGVIHASATVQYDAVINGPLMRATLPTGSPTERLAVTRQAIAAGNVGEVVILGVATVNLDPTGISDPGSMGFAVGSSSGKAQPAKVGQLEILWRQSTSAEGLALVMLNRNISGGATALVRCGTRETLSGYTWLATVCIMVAIGSFSYGEQVVLIGANLETLTQGQYYLAVEMRRRESDNKRVFVTACCCVDGAGLPDVECVSGYKIRYLGEVVGELTPDEFGEWSGTVTIGSTLQFEIRLYFEVLPNGDKKVALYEITSTPGLPCRVDNWAWPLEVTDFSDFDYPVNVGWVPPALPGDCPTQIVLNFSCNTDPEPPPPPPPPPPPE